MAKLEGWGERKAEDDESIPEGWIMTDKVIPKEWKPSQVDKIQEEDSNLYQVGTALTEGWKTNLPDTMHQPSTLLQGNTHTEQELYQPNTLLQPHLLSEGFVRIGLVPLREGHLPVTPVDIMAVRGEGVKPILSRIERGKCLVRMA